MKTHNSDILLSFVIPVYNVEAYLQECVDSILNQITEECEIVLVDDGSTDLSGELCRKYAEESSLIKFIHKKNGGLSSARNEGLSASVGKYITFVDSDDKLFPSCIADILHWIKTEDSDMCFLKAFKFYPDGTMKDLGEGIVRSQIKSQNREYAVNHMASRSKYPGSAWSKLYKREFLTANNLHFPYDRRYSEDLGFVRDCILCARSFDVLDISYYLYRQNRQGSITNNITSKNFNDLLLFISETSQKLTVNKKAIDSAGKAFMAFTVYEYSVLLYLYNFIPAEDKKTALSKLKEFKWILRYACNKKGLITLLLCSVFGIRFSSFLMKQYRRFVEK